MNPKILREDFDRLTAIEENDEHRVLDALYLVRGLRDSGEYMMSDEDSDEVMLGYFYTDLADAVERSYPNHTDIDSSDIKRLIQDNPSMRKYIGKIHFDAEIVNMFRDF